MARSERNQVTGTVAAYSIRRSMTDQWAHEYTVMGEVYTHFSAQDVALMRAGDKVRFTAAAKKRQKSRTRYFAIEELSIEVLSTLSAHGADQGYIYVLVHPAMQGLRKIGFTRDTPRARADALSGNTGVPGKYLVEWSMSVSGDPQRIERAVHAALSKQRYEKEFFKVGQNEAKEAIQLAYADLYPEAVAAIEQSLRARAMAVGRAKKEAESKLRAEQENRATEKRRASPEFKWLTSGMLVVHAQREFDGPAVHDIKAGFFQRLLGTVPETPERVSVEINGREAATRGHFWEVSIDGWLRGAPCRHRADALSLEDALSTLASYLKGRSPQRMNVSFRIPTALLDAPKDPPVERLESGGLVLEVQGREIADYRLMKGNLQSACARVHAIAGTPEPVASPSKGSRRVVEADRKRSRYPFGSKESARVLFKSSGMTERDIEIYLDQFAD